MERYCQICGCILITERKYCSSCKSQQKRDYARARYKLLKESGLALKRYGTTTCIYCGKEVIKNRPNQNTCYSCYKQHRHKTISNYNIVRRTKDGKATIGRQTILALGFEISDMVVHHLDENPNNNSLNNLAILSASNHAKLHRILERNWSLLSKDNNSNLENCWDILRGQLTTAYLETRGANVIKITDIGQSAAEPLNKENIYIYLIYMRKVQRLCTKHLKVLLMVKI